VSIIFTYANNITNFMSKHTVYKRSMWCFTGTDRMTGFKAVDKIVHGI